MINQVEQRMKCGLGGLKALDTYRSVATERFRAVSVERGIWLRRYLW